MDDFLKGALDIVKAQMKIRAMTENDIVLMVQKLTQAIRNISQDEQPQKNALEMAAAKSIRERSILCLECGRKFKSLTNKHLAAHGLTALKYKIKWGIATNIALMCKMSRRNRSKRLKELKLWERRQT